MLINLSRSSLSLILTRLFLPQGSHVVHERKEVVGVEMDCEV
jgi:hypothetical protein